MVSLIFKALGNEAVDLIDLVHFPQPEVKTERKMSEGSEAVIKTKQLSKITEQ